MPVVTTTVLAIGAREMANEKALVNRWAHPKLHTGKDLSKKIPA